MKKEQDDAQSLGFAYRRGNEKLASQHPRNRR